MNSNYSLVDCHCHLDFPEFDEDRSKVLQRASDAGVSHIIIPGVSQSTWTRITDLCSSYDSLHACYGLHPYFVNEHQHRHLKELEKKSATADCIAVGECGLDFRKGQADEKDQLSYFTAQLEIANAINKPVVIHSVRATEVVIQNLKKYPGLRGMVHSYSGSVEQAKQLIELGFMISIGGAVTHDRSKSLRKTAVALPQDSLLLETDAPDQSDMEHSGQRNEPAYITHVLEHLSTLRSTDPEELAAQTTNNAHRLFGGGVALN